MHDDNLMDALTGRRRQPVQEKAPREAPDETLLPDPAKGFEPYSRPANRPLYTIHFILGKDGYRSFPYMNIDESTLTVDGNGQVIRLRLCGFRTQMVTIRGRNLRNLFDFLGQHRIAYVAAADRGRDFASDSEPIITAIEIVEESDDDRGRGA